MIRDFDSELVDDREIRIGGEVFEFIYPHWEVGAQIFDEELTPAQNGDGEPEAFSWKADTEKAIQRIPMFLNPKNDSHKRFKALAARKVDAVPRFQFAQLYRLLVQVTSNLPTTPPSLPPLDDGDGQTEPVLSDASPSTEETSTE
jgi:hypothetical protein